ncbi:dTDP-4-amino-4,6-dideoxygalactose transaminase [Herbihabitans rhizosphaerae]|uniref:dTDP-4-amino-4,6-dideoxygalactose transaminase n=1 Tax=Herbihabitans rhizosphaerae TaxID=1872711 RepID=A0A4Q7KHH9_9PSEU|nr:DegT/DnrJ/EryC1/StrS family aminotransferase [Herbihabitans rhizosphaerae]RZS32707.1 dTDP-4-amino-4,6-dideoxygalactose transaminase [Herbihabitans rhizosphaerae]
MIPLFKVPMSPGAPAAVGDVLASGQIGQGAKVEEFERKIAERIDNPYVATVNSATAALQLGVRLAASTLPELPDGVEGEVLSTPLTMEATNWAILANGLKIKWVDIDEATLNVDLDDLARKITPATRAIMIVHFAGYPVDLARLGEILDGAEAKFGFRPTVIEDSAHAWGASFQGKPIGSHGNITVFSFQAIKHLTSGDGGALVLPNEAQYKRAKLLRWFGIDREVKDRLRNPPDIAEFGYKFHMNDINASIGLANMEIIDDVLKKHRDNAAFYDAELAGFDGVELTERAEDRESSFWIYPMKVERRADFDRKLTDAGVMVSNVHQRNDIHTVVRKFDALLPGLDRVADRIACVPVGSWVSEEDRQHIVDTIKAGW